jgi:putative phage-type endonuclease
MQNIIAHAAYNNYGFNSVRSKPHTPSNKFMDRNCLVRHRGGWYWVTRNVARLSAWDAMHHCVQKSEQWHQRRMHRLTASQIATALSINPYQSRDSLIKQYAGVNIHNAEVFTGNEATRHGEKYEDEAVEKYERIHNCKVLTFGLMPFLNCDDSHFLGGSVDGITTDGTLVEVKCPFRRKIKDDIPVYYIPQVQSMMHGFGLDSVHFIEYVPESTWTPGQIMIHDIPIDPTFMMRHTARLVDFWSRVQMCRIGADALCFSDNTPVVPRKRRKKEMGECWIARSSKDTEMK